MVKLALLSCGHVHTKGYCKAIGERDDCELAVVWDDVRERDGVRVPSGLPVKETAMVDREEATATDDGT